jgi:hypothetical protein
MTASALPYRGRAQQDQPRETTPSEPAPETAVRGSHRFLSRRIRAATAATTGRPARWSKFDGCSRHSPMLNQRRRRRFSVRSRDQHHGQCSTRQEVHPERVSCARNRWNAGRDGHQNQRREATKLAIQEVPSSLTYCLSGRHARQPSRPSLTPGRPRGGSQRPRA